MAIIWQKKAAGHRYEVRTAGATRRLYRNGVCHSEYNPGRILTGSVWDLLLLPVFFFPPESIRRVLVLGVGGGAVLKQLLALTGVEEITGVELNPTHLYIARRFYELDDERIVLHEDDAVDWVKSYSGPPFDVVIDDLFVEDRREPVRAVAADNGWLGQLQALLTETGALVMNCSSPEEMAAVMSDCKCRLSMEFRSVFRLRMPALDNTVGVFLKQEAESRDLRHAMNRIPLLEQALKSKKLKYRIKKFKLAEKG